MPRAPRALLAASLVLAACASGPAAPPRVPQPAAWPPDALGVAWIGHASVLAKVGRSFVLTDPAFFDRVGVTVGSITIGPRRLVAPALPIDALPPLAAVVVSHAHMDSLDLPSLRALPKDAVLVGPTGCRDLLGDLGFRRYVELAWGERTTVGDVTIEAVSVHHWGKRLPWERATRSYNAYTFTGAGHTMLFAPDTAYTDGFRRFAVDGPPLDVAVIGNGAYDPWIRNHADPEEVWQMFVGSGARYLIPVHWDTFRLGLEPLGDALRRLVAAAGPEAERIVVREIGGEWVVPASGRS